MRVWGWHALHRLQSLLIALSARLPIGRNRICLASGPRTPVAQFALANLSLVAGSGFLRRTTVTASPQNQTSTLLFANIPAVEAWSTACAPWCPIAVVRISAGICAPLFVALPRLRQCRTRCATGLVRDRNNACALLTATITCLCARLPCPPRRDQAVLSSRHHGHTDDEN